MAKVSVEHTATIRDFTTAMAQQPADRLTFADSKGDRVAAYFHTGGTTGMPKVAQHLYSGMIYNGWLGNRLLFTNQDKVLNEGRDNCYACIDEDGHYVHIEHACLIDSWEPKGEPGGLNILGTANALQKNLGFFYASWPRSVKDLIIMHKHFAKVQRLLDPTGKLTQNPVFKPFEKLLPEEEL